MDPTMHKDISPQIVAIQKILYQGLEKNTNFDARSVSLNEVPHNVGEIKLEVAFQQAIQITNQKLPLTLHIQLWFPDETRPEMCVHTFTYFWELKLQDRNTRWKYTIQNREDEKYKWVFSSCEEIE